jgi:ABC-type Fe3+ transport system substrate-binding protein
MTIWLQAGPICRLALATLSLAASAAAGPAWGDTAEEILKYAGPDRDQKLVEGAKKEGQVVIYSAMIVNQALRPLTEGFMKKYPFVKATYWRADSEYLTTKIAAEVRANNVVADVLEGTGVGEMVSEANLALPYRTPMLEAYPQKYRDTDGLWAATRLSYYSIAYNTRLVPADKVPRTYEDLLDPQWKGKLAWRVGSASGAALFLTNLRLAWGEEKARAYFLALREQRIVNFGSGSARTLVDRVVAGEYPIALQIFAHHPLISKAKGAAVNSRLLAPVPTTAATMVIPKGLRHPYAALLLVDYILSKEGQTKLLEAEYFPAHPDVVPSDTLAQVVPKRANVEEQFVGPRLLNKYNESSERIYEELFR